MEYHNSTIVGFVNHNPYYTELLSGSKCSKQAIILTCRQDSVQDVTEVSRSDGQESSFWNGRSRIFEVSAQVCSGNDSGAGREVDGEDAEEGVQVARPLVHRVFRIKVFFVVLHAVADEAFRLFLLARRNHRSDHKINLSQHENRL
jgi:hypothetical protein